MIIKPRKVVFEPTTFDFKLNQYEIAELVGKVVEIVPHWDMSPILGGKYNGQQRFMMVGHFYLSWFPAEDFKFLELTEEENISNNFPPFRIRSFSVN